MEVKEDFYMYRSGVYRYTSPPQPVTSATATPQPVTSSTQRTGYHSIRVIGYVDYQLGGNHFN